MIAAELLGFYQNGKTWFLAGHFILTVVHDELKRRIAAGEGDGQAGDFMPPARPGCGHSALVGTEKLFIFESDSSPLLSLSHGFTGVNS